MAESEEELRNLLMKVKEESEKVAVYKTARRFIPERMIFVLDF